MRICSGQERVSVGFVSRPGCACKHVMWERKDPVNASHHKALATLAVRISGLDRPRTLNTRQNLLDLGTGTRTHQPLDFLAIPQEHQGWP